MAQKAPGKAFRKGISLVDLFRMFPDDAKAEAWFAGTRWPNGPACPYCGSAHVLSGAKHATMPYRCREKGCRKRFSVKTGTVMEASNIGYQKMGDRHLPCADQPQVHLLHETASRLGDQPEVRMAYGAPVAPNVRGER